MMSYLRRIIIAFIICMAPAAGVYFYEKNLAQTEFDAGRTESLQVRHVEFGYLLTQISPQTEQVLRTQIEPEKFDKFILPIMRQQAYGMSIRSGIVAFLIVLLLEGYRWYKDRDMESYRSSVFSRAFERKTKKIIYKRK